MIRAIRLELAKPLDESWEDAGVLLRTLAKATPKLLNAAMDARIAIQVAGRDAVKAKIAPDAKAASADGLAYQAVLRETEALQRWGAKKKHRFSDLDVPGAMSSAISRAASQAYARRDQERAHFASERVIVRGDGVKLSRDTHGVVLALKLRPTGLMRFAVAHSTGSHRDTLKQIASGEVSHGDCKLQWDDRRRKWFALLSYEPPQPAPISVDPARAMVVHRGIRNALYLLSSTGQSKSLSGAKFMAQRRQMQTRMRDTKRISPEERGGGAKGHGRERRYDHYDALQGKLARVTHTFCQQAAAFTDKMAGAWGCGLVVIEDYGGVEPDNDPVRRRILDRFPLYEMKQCHASRLERSGRALREVPSAYISTTCPRCHDVDARNHNRRTGMFHCRACVFERPADWVAAYWMLEHSGADMTVWHERLRRERELADQMRKGA